VSEFADPRTVRSIVAARKACARAVGQWATSDTRPSPGGTGLWAGEGLYDSDDDPAAEAEQLALDAVDHLEEGRWDEACECAEATVTLAEEHEQGAVWREFVLLVEEAAETGRGGES
jgi:hypothetical protein